MTLMKSDYASMTINLIGFGIFIVLVPLLYSNMAKMANLISWEMWFWAVIYGVVHAGFWPRFKVGITGKFVMMKDFEAFKRTDRGAMLFLISATLSPCVNTYLIGINAIYCLQETWIIVRDWNHFTLEMEKYIPRGLVPILDFRVGLINIIVLFISASNLSSSALTLLICGTIFLIIGGMIYVVKKPDPWPNRFGFHEFFHVFFSTGIIILYFLVQSALIP